MAGLDPAIQDPDQGVDARIKSGHDQEADHGSVGLHPADVKQLHDNHEQQHRKDGQRNRGTLA